jgi:hypothetical protein
MLKSFVFLRKLSGAGVRAFPSPPFPLFAPVYPCPSVKSVVAWFGCGFAALGPSVVKNQLIRSPWSSRPSRITFHGSRFHFNFLLSQFLLFSMTSNLKSPVSEFHFQLFSVLVFQLFVFYFLLFSVTSYLLIFPCAALLAF